MDVSPLRRLRQQAVMSQQQLADESGVARDTISKLETGQRRAYPTTIRKLAASLGVKPGELVGNWEGQPRALIASEGQEQDKPKKKKLGF
ncbi:MAG: helix-turn-helix transcriptional regulator [Rubrobacter sp.]|nr:helix-turn-helix transcriptional regulator [Rubrobacter sp.]